MVWLPVEDSDPMLTHAARFLNRYLLRCICTTPLVLITVQLTAGKSALAQSSLPEGAVQESVGTQGELQKNNQEKDTSFSLGDAFENLGRVYKDDTNDTVQEVWLLGRYHGQYHWTEASTGEDDGYESRRTRLGAQAKLFRQATFHGQMVSGTDIQPFYNGFTELWAQWCFRREIALTIGQQKNRFTHDRNVSSRYLNYLERAMLTNMFNVDYTPAITLQGQVGGASYYTGVFTNKTGQNMGDSFTNLDSGYSLISQLYYDLGKVLGLGDLTLYGSYIHSDANDKATNMKLFDNGISGAVMMTRGHAALVTEVTAGIGSDKGNATGINLQPSYFLNHKWQVASRYQLAWSNNAKGLSPQRRYEREVDFPAGDLYQAGYVGLNYYIAKHRLKLMTGLEYAHMSGQDAWTASTMARFYFGPHSGGAFPMNQILPLEYD
jgi:phosphate-selective porin OprO/OprP